MWRECGCGERFGRVPCVDGLCYVKRCGGRQASFTDVYPSPRRVSSRRREENGKKKKSETKRNETRRWGNGDVVRAFHFCGTHWLAPPGPSPFSSRLPSFWAPWWATRQLSGSPSLASAAPSTPTALSGSLFFGGSARAIHSSPYKCLYKYSCLVDLSSVFLSSRAFRLIVFKSCMM